jgi:hypothetical protein
MKESINNPGKSKIIDVAVISDKNKNKLIIMYVLICNKKLFIIKTPPLQYKYHIVVYHKLKIFS